MPVQVIFNLGLCRDVWPLRGLRLCPSPWLDRGTAWFAVSNVSELTGPFVVLPATRDDPPGAVTQIRLRSLRYRLNAEGFLSTATYIKHLINVS